MIDMEQKQIDCLTKSYNGLQSVSFKLENKRFPVIIVNNAVAKAEISIYGAHVMAYTPHGENPVLWLSKAAKIMEGQSIRGGIPVCWPWFGAHPEDPSMPLHGFTRNFFWHLDSITEPDENNTELVLSLTNVDVDPKLNPSYFKLELIVNVGRELTVGLKSLNTGTDKLCYTAGLHSYFNIGDISKTLVKGVEGHNCFNKESSQEEKQSGDLRFNGMTTRIYRKIQQAVIHDSVMKRQIEVEVDGGESIVVWNPGTGVEERFAGFAPNDEKTMLCVEAANPIGYGIELQPGESHCLSTRIRCWRF